MHTDIRLPNDRCEVHQLPSTTIRLPNDGSEGVQKPTSYNNQQFILRYVLLPKPDNVYQLVTIMRFFLV